MVGWLWICDLGSKDCSIVMFSSVLEQGTLPWMFLCIPVDKWTTAKKQPELLLMHGHRLQPPSFVILILHCTNFWKCWWRILPVPFLSWDILVWYNLVFQGKLVQKRYCINWSNVHPAMIRFILISNVTSTSHTLHLSPPPS